MGNIREAYMREGPDRRDDKRYEDIADQCVTLCPHKTEFLQSERCKSCTCNLLLYMDDPVRAMLFVQEARGRHYIASRVNAREEAFAKIRNRIDSFWDTVHCVVTIIVFGLYIAFGVIAWRACQRM